MIWDPLNPFSYLGTAAGKIVADGWTAAMLGLWNAGLWLLRLVLTLGDTLLTPDLTEGGPAAHLYRVTFWIAGALLLIMALVQLGIAAIQRDGRSLARVAIGFGQFTVVWAGWVSYGLTIVAACSGLTRALMGSLLNVTSWSAWKPWQPFTPADIVDGTVATVLGLMGLLLFIAAIGHFLVLLARAAALMVLAATTPIAAAGLVADTGRAWFWKSLRWFHAAALSPVLMVLVLGVGTQFTTGVANGMSNKLEAAIGTAVPGVILILVATFSPLALFKLLAFVDPGTTSGAGMRATLAASGGIQGLLAGAGRQPTGTGVGAATDDQGRTSSEAGAEDATTQRFTTAAQGGMSLLGTAGQIAATGLGWMATIGGAGASLGADATNQMGVGHNTYPPDFSLAGRRATQAGPDTTGPGSPLSGSTTEPSDPPPAPAGGFTTTATPATAPFAGAGAGGAASSGSIPGATGAAAAGGTSGAAAAAAV